LAKIKLYCYFLKLLYQGIEMNPDEVHPKQTAAERDKASPVWDMSQERVFEENLLSQRFNFFLLFFSLVVTGSVNAKTQVLFNTILGIGSLVCVLLAVVLAHTQQKLDLILKDLFTDESHPATIIDRRVMKGGMSRRRMIGLYIPWICCIILIIGLALALAGVVEVR
jgi:hypothetical protein